MQSQITQKRHINPLIASGGGGNLPETRLSNYCTKTAWNFWNGSVTFPRNILAISITVPQILVGNEGHPRC